MMRGPIVVTGAQGFLGRYVVKELQQAFTGKVIGVGRSPRNDDEFTHRIRLGDRLVPAPLPATLVPGPQYRYVPLDLLNDDLTAFFTEVRPGLVLHLASGLRDDPPERLVATNILGAHRLVMGLRAAPCRVVFGSSGGVYGEPVAGLPIAEGHACDPRDVYSVTKLAAEHLTRVEAFGTGIEPVWGRLFNLVGPGQDERHVCGRVASSLSTTVFGGGPRILDLGRLDTTRDFIDIRDAARAMIILAENGASGAVYNIASGQETPIRNIVDKLLRISGLEDQVTVRSDTHRQADIPRHYGDIRLLEGLGFRREFSLDQTLDNVWSYYQTMWVRSGVSRETLP